MSCGATTAETAPRPTQARQPRNRVVRVDFKIEPFERTFPTGPFKGDLILKNLIEIEFENGKSEMFGNVSMAEKDGVPEVLELAARWIRGELCEKLHLPPKDTVWEPHIERKCARELGHAGPHSDDPNVGRA